jgi:hypothetical protein
MMSNMFINQLQLGEISRERSTRPGVMLHVLKKSAEFFCCGCGAFLCSALPTQVLMKDRRDPTDIDRQITMYSTVYRMITAQTPAHAPT